MLTDWPKPIRLDKSHHITSLYITIRGAANITTVRTMEMWNEEFSVYSKYWNNLWVLIKISISVKTILSIPYYIIYFFCINRTIFLVIFSKKVQEFRTNHSRFNKKREPFPFVNQLFTTNVSLYLTLYNTFYQKSTNIFIKYYDSGAFPGGNSKIVSMNHLRFS